MEVEADNPRKVSQLKGPLVQMLSVMADITVPLTEAPVPNAVFNGTPFASLL
jgi:hypothetical protein